MKTDECDLMLGKTGTMSPKRQRYIQKKWKRKGWVGKKLDLMRKLVSENRERMEDLDGHVVIVNFKKWYGQPVGILEDHGDNGWYFYTLNHVWSIFPDEIAFIVPHPKPRDLWEKMNRKAWKESGIPDRYHKKPNFFYRGTEKDGECLQCCQCRKIY